MGRFLCDMAQAMGYVNAPFTTKLNENNMAGKAGFTYTNPDVPALITFLKAGWCDNMPVSCQK